MSKQTGLKMSGIVIAILFLTSLLGATVLLMTPGSTKVEAREEDRLPDGHRFARRRLQHLADRDAPGLRLRPLRRTSPNPSAGISSPDLLADLKGPAAPPGFLICGARPASPSPEIASVDGPRLDLRLGDVTRTVLDLTHLSAGDRRNRHDVVEGEPQGMLQRPALQCRFVGRAGIMNEHDDFSPRAGVDADDGAIANERALREQPLEELAGRFRPPMLMRSSMRPTTTSNPSASM